MMNPARSLVLFSTVALALSACNSTTEAGRESMYGRWSRTTNDLPPVTLEVRRENGAAVGQVWLSGVTYTYPAFLDDTSVVVANPVSSALAAFHGVLTGGGEMRATLRNNASEVVVTLRKEK